MTGGGGSSWCDFVHRMLGYKTGYRGDRSIQVVLIQHMSIPECNQVKSATYAPAIAPQTSAVTFSGNFLFRNMRALPAKPENTGEGPAHFSLRSLRQKLPEEPFAFVGNAGV
jgi:hypothetical protein